MNIEYLKSNGIIIEKNVLTINNKNVTINVKNNKQYIVFNTGEIIELDKVYNIKMSTVSGKGNVGVVLE